MNKFQLTLALCMLITGSINTIATKTVDWQSAVGVFHVCPSWSPSPPSPPSAPSAPSSPPGKPCFFVHPFFQALGMFVGEFSCFLVYFGARFLARLRGLPVDPRSWTTAPRPQFNWFLFLLPACLDMTGASMMYVGLLMPYASDFQMLRGSVVLFPGAISRACSASSMSTPSHPLANEPPAIGFLDDADAAANSPQRRRRKESKGAGLSKDDCS